MPFYKYVANKRSPQSRTPFGMKLAEYHRRLHGVLSAAMETIPFEKLSNSFDFDLEMIVLAKVKGLPVAENSPFPPSTPARSRT